MLSVPSIEALRSAFAASANCVAFGESVLSRGLLMDRIPTSGTVVRITPASASTVIAAMTEPRASSPLIVLEEASVRQEATPSAFAASPAFTIPRFCSLVLVTESVPALSELQALAHAAMRQSVAAPKDNLFMNVMVFPLFAGFPSQIDIADKQSGSSYSVRSTWLIQAAM
jgi:hypothetical protein